MMARFLLKTVIGALAVVFVAAQVPKPEIIVNTIGITTEPDNLYFENWKGTVHPGGQVLTVNMPVLKDLPEEAMMSVKVEMSGQLVIDFETTVCDGLKDESFGKEIVKYAEPKGQFPEECPFVKGKSFVIENLEIPNDKLPQNTQPGAFNAEVKLYTVSKDNPELRLVADGEIIVG